MGSYKEKKEKNILEVAASDEPVMFNVDCENMTIATVSYQNGDDYTPVPCGSKAVCIGTGNELKGKTLIFSGEASNPQKDPIKVISTIYQAEKTLVYAFPGNYTGIPAFDKKDRTPKFIFYVKFV